MSKRLRPRTPDFQSSVSDCIVESGVSHWRPAAGRSPARRRRGRNTTLPFNATAHRLPYEAAIGPRACRTVTRPAGCAPRPKAERLHGGSRSRAAHAGPAASTLTAPHRSQRDRAAGVGFWGGRRFRVAVVSRGVSALGTPRRHRDHQLEVLIRAAERAGTQCGCCLAGRRGGRPGSGGAIEGETTSVPHCSWSAHLEQPIWASDPQSP